MSCKKHGYTNGTFCPACDLETIEKLSVDHNSKIRRLEQLEAFTAEIMEDWWEGDLDGGSRQDIAIKHGVLVETIVTEPCGENCACAGYDVFPQTCYRIVKQNVT